jgi:signal transduction histidine kinase
MDALLKVTNLSKTIGTLPVLRNVNLEVNAGEVLGLAGWTGAGKSVLASILAGVQVPDEGELYFAGKRIRWPFQSRNFGFEVIHQEPRIVEGLDICSNIFMGNEIGFPKWNGKRFFLPQTLMDEKATRILKQLDVSFNSLRENGTNLSIEQRQLINIARAMVRPSQLILVDDTAALLSYHYQQILLSLIQTWQQEGKAVIFSSDNLNYLFSITDKIVVLREGSRVAEYRTDEVSHETLVADLVGTTDQQQITPIIWALDSYYRARERAEVLRHNQILLKRDLAARDELNKQLLTQLNEQVNALDKANRAIQDAQRRLLSLREQERKSLARELHDQTIQDLLSLNYQLEGIEENEKEGSPIKEGLQSIRHDVRKLVEELRLICSNLRPPTIDSLGLRSAILSFANEWATRTRISFTLNIEANFTRMPETTELSLFRIIQECLHNIEKHSKATTASISIKNTGLRTILISVQDNGVGLPNDFDLSRMAANNHYGLLGISERIALMGGRVRMQNRQEGGMLLQSEIPLPSAKMNPLLGEW